MRNDTDGRGTGDISRDFGLVQRDWSVGWCFLLWLVIRDELGFLAFCRLLFGRAVVALDEQGSSTSARRPSCPSPKFPVRIVFFRPFSFEKKKKTPPFTIRRPQVWCVKPRFVAKKGSPGAPKAGKPVYMLEISPVLLVNREAIVILSSRLVVTGGWCFG